MSSTGIQNGNSDAEPVSELLPKPGRTRICGPQSKNGCLTCKARRIKCDEEKPSCLRCARSGRVCQGYPSSISNKFAPATSVVTTRRETAALSHRLRATPSPGWALMFGPLQTMHQHRLTQSGLDLLTSDAGSFGAAHTVVDALLPQLCRTIPSITMAATALGAAYQLHASRNPRNPADEIFAASQYRSALRKMQQDLFAQPDGPIPLIMMCFMLSIAEILLGQETNALLHLHAASKLLQDRRDNQRSTASRLTQCDPFNADIRSLEDQIGIILCAVDSHICSYAPSRPPDLSVVVIPPVLPPIVDLRTAHVILTQLTHACYGFTREAYRFKYRPQFAPPGIYVEQGRLLAHLSTWLTHLNSAVVSNLRFCSDSSPTSLDFSAQFRKEVKDKKRLLCQAMVLRITALSILIHLSTILTPYETAYSSHSQQFQQIISDGEAVLSMRDAAGRKDESNISSDCRSTKTDTDGSPAGDIDTNKNTQNHNFRPGPGIIQPLFLTAYKYRHPVFRRRAIALLDRAGREGPWDGQREASITTRIMELEEMQLTNASRNGDGEGLELGEVCLTTQGVNTTASEENYLSGEGGKHVGLLSPATPHSPLQEIPESALINNIGISPGGDIPLSSHHQHQTSTRQRLRVVVVRFSRCDNIETMLAYPCGHERDNLDTHILGLCAQNPCWVGWEERLKF